MDRVSSLPSLPPRPIDGHKGLFGRALIVGGNASMIGAPVLAGTAALRMGSGLVQLAAPKSVLANMLAVTPELIGLALKDGTQDKLLAAAQSADVVVLGPGLGKSRAAESRVLRLVRLSKPMVIDADALNTLAAQKQWPRAFKAEAVLTPHPGEMARLAKLFGRDSVPSDEEGRIGIATEAAEKFGQVVVLKGRGTIVADANRVYINTTGDSSLSKAGTGDVLSGVIGSLLGQRMSGFDAACAGVWLHGRAGELAGQRLGLRSVLATDVIATLPQAIAEYEKANPAQQ